MQAMRVPFIGGSDSRPVHLARQLMDNDDGKELAMLYAGLATFGLAMLILVLDIVGVATGAGALVNVMLMATSMALGAWAVGAVKVRHHHHHAYQQHRFSH